MPRIFTAENRDELRIKLLDKGFTLEEVARRFDVSASTLSKALNE